MKKVAVLIGVENYQDRLTARMEFARADVKSIADRLAQQCGFDDIRVLADLEGPSAATLPVVNDILLDLSAELWPDDLFLLCFIGHCVEKSGRGYLLLRDSRQASPEESGLSLESLRKSLERLEAKRRVLMIDAFRGSPHRWRAGSHSRMSETLSEQLVAVASARSGEGTTTALLSACQVGQRAYERSDEDHGVFAHALVKGLESPAWEGDKLDVKHLASYVSQQVRDWSQNATQTGPPQTVWYEEFGEGTPILLAGDAAPEAEQPLPTQEDPRVLTPLERALEVFADIDDVVDLPETDLEPESRSEPLVENLEPSAVQSGPDEVAVEAAQQDQADEAQAELVDETDAETWDESDAWDEAETVLRAKPGLESEAPSETPPASIPVPEIVDASPVEVAVDDSAMVSETEEGLSADLPELPPVPADVLQLRRTLDDLERTVADLQAGSHPRLGPALELVRSAEREWKEAKRDLDSFKPNFSDEQRRQIKEAHAKNPKGSLSDLCTLAPDTTTAAILPYVRRLRDTEKARQALKVAEQQFESKRDQELGEARARAAEVRAQLESNLLADLGQVLDRFFDKTGDVLEFPLQSWIAFRPSLRSRHYPWDSRTILAEAERRHRQRLYERWRDFSHEERPGSDTAYAIDCLRKAAELGHREAQFDLAEDYYAGHCLERDYEEAAKWYIKAAERGHAQAQFSLGWCYFNGTGVARDLDKAAQWYRKSASQDYAAAQFNLGWCYYTGTVVERDRNEAVRWYRMAAERDHPEAQFALGWCYSTGHGVTQNRAEAARWYRKAAEQGHSEAQYTLGWCYSMASGVPENHTTAALWYRKAAEQGHPDAQFNLAVRYGQGKGVELNLVEAAKWFGEAAAQGYARAQYRLAQCYAAGHGVKQDRAEAVKWFRNAAEQEHAQAQFELACCCLKGTGTARNTKEAVKWLSKSAERSYAPAQFHLAECYSSGEGVATDRVKSADLYRKAAEQGHMQAQFRFAVCCWTGNGVARDWTEAAKWFQKAAEQGDALAQYNLGACYYNGWGVTKYRKEAYRWFRKAAEQGEEGAQRILDALG